MKNDPLTIIITLNKENKAEGIIYFDDEESLEYQKDIYSILKISYDNLEIDFEWIKYNYIVNNNIEKILILGENKELLNKKAELFMIKNEKYNLEFSSGGGDFFVFLLSNEPICLIYFLKKKNLYL